MTLVVEVPAPASLQPRIVLGAVICCNSDLRVKSIVTSRLVSLAYAAGLGNLGVARRDGCI